MSRSTSAARLRRTARRVLAQALLAVACVTAAGAQGGGAAAPLSLKRATAWALAEHPLARIADAVEARGPAELLAARGAYDPRLEAGVEHKRYLGTEYFTYGGAGLTWQSPLAFRLEGGRKWANGTYLNPERNVPADGQGYLSVKLPLLQGLLTDKYRVGVERGRVSVALNRAAAEVIRNELRYDLAVAYAEWAYAERVLVVTRETEALIATRLTATRGLYAGGDKPAVDTLEAAVALANQRLATLEASVDANVARQTFRALYFPLAADARPAGASTGEPDAAAEPVLPPDTLGVLANPALAELRLTAADLALQRRLKREYRKPRLDVSGSLLGDGFDLTPGDREGGGFDALGQAYKVGATFSYPLFTREARGEVQLAELKLAETGAKLGAERAGLDAKARAFRSATAELAAQLTDARALAGQTDALLAAERELFDLGESTQFLLNSREQTVQKARLTVAKLTLARAKAVASWRAATGRWD